MVEPSFGACKSLTEKALLSDYVFDEIVELFVQQLPYEHIDDSELSSNNYKSCVGGLEYVEVGSMGIIAGCTHIQEDWEEGQKCQNA